MFNILLRIQFRKFFSDNLLDSNMQLILWAFCVSVPESPEQKQRETIEHNLKLIFGAQKFCFFAIFMCERFEVPGVKKVKLSTSAKVIGN